MKPRRRSVFRRLFGMARATEPAGEHRNGPAWLKVATYNIHSCINTARKMDMENIARVIQRMDADVVALQEVDAQKPRTGYAEQARWLADRVGMRYWFHPVVEIGREKYGLAVLARIAAKKVKFDRLPTLKLRKPREIRGAMWLTLETDRGPVQFVNTHLGLAAAERRLQIDALLGERWLGGLPDSEPVILCGDFNASRNSPVYRQVCGTYVDVRRAAAGKSTAGATFLSYFPMLCLDHIFVSRHFHPVRVEVPSAPPARTASDHLPVFAELAPTELSAI